VKEQVVRTARIRGVEKGRHQALLSQVSMAEVGTILALQSQSMLARVAGAEEGQ
jgi:hypothetical protein